jgi:hypothetical protein
VAGGLLRGVSGVLVARGSAVAGGLVADALMVPRGRELRADGARAHASLQVQQLKAQLAQAAQARMEEGRDRAAAHSSELAGLRAKMEGVIASLRRDLASAKEGHAREEASMWDQHKVGTGAG